MISQISWGSFLIYTGGALLVYYLVLIVVKGSGWKAKIRKTGGLPPSFMTSKNASGKKENNNAQLMPIVHDAVDEIQAYLTAVESDVNKEVILKGIADIINKYPSLKDSAFQSGINNLIALTCANNCSLHLSDEDLRRLW